MKRVIWVAFALGACASQGKIVVDTPINPYQKPDISEITGIDEDEEAAATAEPSAPASTPAAAPAAAPTPTPAAAPAKAPAATAAPAKAPAAPAAPAKAPAPPKK